MANFSKLNFRGDDEEHSQSEVSLEDDSLAVDGDISDFESVDDVVEALPGGLKLPFRLRPLVPESPVVNETAPSPAVEKPVEQGAYGEEIAVEAVRSESPIAVNSSPVEEVSTDVDMESSVDDLFPEDDLGDFEAVNPLLDDDEELWQGAEESISKTDFIRGTTGEVMDRDDLSEEDFTTFEGFGDSAVVNPLLEEDDEYVPASVNPFIDDDEAEFDEAPGHKTPLAEVRDKVGKNAEPRRFFPEGLDAEFDKRVVEAPSRKEVVAAEREGKIRKAEASKASAKEFKSEFQRKATETVNVNELGETKTERAKERKRLAKSAPKGKLASHELEFFKSLGSRKSQYSEGLRTTELLSGPMNQFATAKEKRERKEKLERVFDSRVSYRQGANFKLNEKMTEMLSFLALFRYATHSHIARMFGESPRTTLDRLYRMQANGLVESRKIYAQHAIWFLTEPGIIVSGYDVRRITDSRLTYSMFPHQFTVNHIAANLWGGKLNVLNLQDFPSKNRSNARGVPIFGEQLTSELEILSSFAKMKLFEDSASFRPKLMGMMDAEFKKWVDSDRREVLSPELVYGNEWMFTLFPPLSVGVAYHVPDLVVKRQRDPSGAPKSIAVEIEINNKPIGSYKKTLQAYAEDKRIFDKVIWVCKTVGPAKKLEQVGRELGIYQTGKLKIVPIWTNDGVFKGRDLWTI